MTPIQPSPAELLAEAISLETVFVFVLRSIALLLVGSRHPVSPARSPEAGPPELLRGGAAFSEAHPRGETEKAEAPPPEGGVARREAEGGPAADELENRQRKLPEEDDALGIEH